ncbi:MAG: hypothetical protein AUH96_09210 [Nitrospirae bacterium 13_2_20CM_2_61_4]|nr:MAG: hypothetical protein AUH96_09210 [Nitrospirae bacterium 13_2_20CM_2_61_4]
MAIGWSLSQYGGAWHEGACVQASITDSKLVIDIEVKEDADTITVTASSTDGARYTGDYRYREGSDSNGLAFFERYQGPAGQVLIGERHEVGRQPTRWIITVS